MVLTFLHVCAFAVLLLLTTATKTHVLNSIIFTNICKIPSLGPNFYSRRSHDVQLNVLSFIRSNKNKVSTVLRPCSTKPFNDGCWGKMLVPVRRFMLTAVSVEQKNGVPFLCSLFLFCVVRNRSQNFRRRGKCRYAIGSSVMK